LTFAVEVQIMSTNSQPDVGSAAIPEKGLGAEPVLESLRARKQGDPDYKAPRTFSLVYYMGEEHTKLVQDAFNLYFSENALNPTAFKSLKNLEHEVVRMGIGLLNGPEDAVGTMTSGGTESCLLAVKTWRDYARAKRPFVRKPEMIVADTVHVAWEKGAEYFDVKMLRAPVGRDLRLDPEAVRRKISRNTILIVASAPEYPHGMIDPIEALGALAEERNIPLHVDACLGGFLLPFMEAAGAALPLWDFRVKGVRSISADVHKYGFSAKGASVILYRSMDFLEHQFFVSQDWPGGVFLSHGLLGTRPGGAIAAAWASLMAIGRDGYIEYAKTTMSATAALREGIAAIPGLAILGSPLTGIFAFGSTEPGLDIYAVGDQLGAKGWHVDRLQRPEGLHAMITPRHANIVSEYLADLREAVETVRANPALKRQGDAAMYGMISRVPLRGAVRSEIFKMARKMYGPKGELP
jgi:glutamate/tyrosine decarboxylase-like PLP-dependent enzyme